MADPVGTHLQRAREVFRPEIATLRAVERLPDEAFTHAADLAPTSSTTATLVLGDALGMAILDARGFKLR